MSLKDFCIETFKTFFTRTLGVIRETIFAQRCRSPITGVSHAKPYLVVFDAINGMG